MQNMLSNPQYKFEYLDKYKYLTNVCLNVTDDCNLHCRYCFVEQHPHYMTLQVAIDSVKYIYNNLQIKKELGYCTENEKCSLNFFGGEPTLMWDSIIVPLTNYIKEHYNDEIYLGITTNGTLLNEERITFLKENDIGVLLSIDGGPEAQCFNRPCKDPQMNSFQLVSRNIPKLLELFPNTVFRATIAQESVNTVFESYLYAEKMGFQHIFQIPNEREHWTSENLNILKEEIKKIYYYNLKYFLNNQIPPLTNDLIVRSFEYIKWIDEQIILKNNRHCGDKTCDRCGLGTTYGSISYDGTIYGCQEQDSRSTNDLFKLGNIYTGGIEEERQIKLLKIYSQSGDIVCENPQLCQNCKMKLRCVDDCCPSTSYDMYNNCATKSEVNCVFYQTLIDNALTLMNILVPMENDAFKSWLSDIYERQQKWGIKTNGN